MRKFPFVFIFLGSLIFLRPMAKGIENPALVRVDIQNLVDFNRLLSGEFDIAYVESGQFAEVIAYADDLTRLREGHFDIDVVHEDLAAFYLSRFPQGTTNGPFKTFDEILTFMDNLHGAYPGLTTAKAPIGYSVEGRPLWMLKVSDNPTVDEDEPEMIITGLTHAREPMGGEVCLRFMEYLCENYADPAVAEIVNGREFYIIPVVNPDGYEYNRLNPPNSVGFWRKNRRDNGDGSYGVDLNRNWGYAWGHDDLGSSPIPSSDTYRGPYAVSEPETQTLQQFIASRDALIVVNFHAYGNMFLYPWSYYQAYTRDQGLFHSYGADIQALNGFFHGITVDGWHYLANGESCDWLYAERSAKPMILGFVIELGHYSQDGFYPPPERHDLIWQDALDALWYLVQKDGTPYNGDCDYVPGDANGDGTCNGLDAVFLNTYLKGGTPPPDECSALCPGTPAPFYAAADANGSCSANGIDVTFLVTYLKGGNRPPTYCGDCPPLINPYLPNP